ncbi:hypothetical protein E1091_00960 [Micromonospora fluostatini]|uniref:Uncharacterized protein n=1 Tax=Micromonospora fluostatini TaxID=1629071 RepID=A0ABY2DLT8_9ACTN|nr:hypothetical protein E1091_00960 [Micromonospora fluostatini]
MEIINRYHGPAALPAAVATWSAGPVVPSVARPSAPQVHQVEVQAELILASTPSGIEGTSGFTGKGNTGAMKRLLDARGVPPRGRPV